MTTLTSPKARAALIGVPVLILSLWALAVAALAANDAFLPPSNGLPLPFIPAVLTPVALFLAAHHFVPAARVWVAQLDLALLAGAQAWRMLGAVFLVLWPSLAALRLR